MYQKTGIILRRTIGIVLIVLGIPALPIPIISGIFFITVGLYLLSLDSSRFRVYLERLVAQNYRAARMYRKIDNVIRNMFHIRKP